MFNNHNGWGNSLHQPQPPNQEPLLSDFAAVVTPSTEKKSSQYAKHRTISNGTIINICITSHNFEHLQLFSGSVLFRSSSLYGCSGAVSISFEIITWEQCYILRLLTAWIIANATIMLNYLFMPVVQYRQAVTEIYKKSFN